MIDTQSALSRKFLQRGASVIASGFSLLTIFEGSRVLLNIVQPDYIVLQWLLIYNVVMGVVGVATSVVIWMNHRTARTFTVIIMLAHFVVLLVVATMFLSNGHVSEHSIHAMILRTGIWLLITFLAWKSSTSNKPQPLGIDRSTKR